MKKKENLSAFLAAAIVLQSFGSAAAASVVQSAPRGIPISGAFTGLPALASPAPLGGGMIKLSALSLLSPAPGLNAPAPLVQQTGLVAPLVTALAPAVSVLTVSPVTLTPAKQATPGVITAKQNLDEARTTLETTGIGQDSSQEEHTGATMSRWERFWSNGSKSKAVTETVNGKTSGPAPLLKAADNISSEKKVVPAPRRGIAAAAGLAFALPAWIPNLLATAGPLMTMVGTATGLVLAFRAADAGIDKLAAKFGWGAKTSVFVKMLSRAVMVGGLIAIPASLPLVWAGALPYVTGGGFLAAAYGLDKLVQKGVEKLAKTFGWSEKTKGLVSAGARLLVWTAGGAFGLEAAGISVAGIASSLYGMVAPYMGTAGTMLGTFAVGRVVRWGVDRIAEKAGWQPNTKVAVRLIAGIVVWTAGIGVGLASAGVSTKGLMATFGVGGIAVTMAAKDFIGNFIEGIKVLLTHPFLVGDKIKIGDKEYLVKDMGLRYLQLEKEPGSITLMTYTQLADKTITIFREYKTRKDLNAPRPRVGILDFIRMATPDARPDMKKAAIWTALGLGLVIGLPALSAWAALPWLAGALPYLQGGAVLFVSRSVSRWLSGIVTRVAEKAGWDKQVTTVLKLAAQSLAYVIGGTIALRTFGVNWSTLLASLGASSIAIGWASADIIGNLIQGFQILMSQPFKIGDTIEVGAVKGAVVDMNMQYVVLEHADKSHTLVPYAVIKASAFTVAEKEEKK